MIAICTSTACSTTDKINTTAPDPAKTPHYLDSEIRELSATLIDEQRKLARIRQSKLDALLTDEDRKRQQSMNSQIIAGFDKRVDLWELENDIETVLRGIAALVGWGADRVYPMGIRPANGLLVKVRLKNEMIHNALDQIDVQVGTMVDIRIDPNFETIILSYKSLDER